jgi:hypothetical protein
MHGMTSQQQLSPRQQLAHSLQLSLGNTMPSRTEVRQVACPHCAAAPGSPCLGRSGRARAGNHAERVELHIGSRKAPNLIGADSELPANAAASAAVEHRSHAATTAPPADKSKAARRAANALVLKQLEKDYGCSSDRRMSPAKTRRQVRLEKLADRLLPPTTAPVSR